MLKKSLIILLFFLMQNAFSANSLRRCVILPITDNLKGSVANSVFLKVERYLQESNWCYYESNSGLIDLLQRYQHKLDMYLHNPKVLSVIARKTGAGSLINIMIRPGSAGIEIAVKVYGENGTDIYLNEKSIVRTLDNDVVSSMIINWLEEYNKTIPYDVRISGVLGDSFTLDMGSNIGLNTGDKVEFFRATKKKRHPLFKEIVDWETKPVATGNIIHVTDQQAQGKILKYAGVRDRTRLEDWGIIKKSTKLDPNHKPIGREDEYSFGRLGTIALKGNIGTLSVTRNTTGGSNKQSGMMFGGNVDTEMWITRHYWLGLEIDFTTGKIKTDTGSFNLDENSLQTSRYKIKVGHKYLPLGFFYGPQIDFVIGYDSHSFSLENSISDGIVAVNYSGLALGAHASIPVYKKVRINIGFDFIPIASFKEEVIALGEPDGISIYNFKLGAVYNHKPTVDILGGINVKSAKASYDGTESNINHKHISLDAGVRFTF
jgi:hypothetical protein